MAATLLRMDRSQDAIDILTHFVENTQDEQGREQAMDLIQKVEANSSFSQGK